MDRSARCLVALMITAVGTTGALAEDAGGTTSPEVTATVGWLGWADAPVAGKGCTAVLVAPDAVLTAAHCVTRDPAAAPPAPKGLIFVPGWGGEDAQPVRQAVRIDLPAPRELLGGRLQYDLALVRLDAPVTETDPLTLAGTGGTPDSVIALGYAAANPNRLHIVECVRVMDAAPVLGLDCPALPGFSGGPVVAETGNGWRLTAVMVARGTEANLVGTYAVRPSDDLMALIGAD